MISPLSIPDSYIWHICSWVGARLQSDSTVGNRYNLEHGKFALYTRKMIFSIGWGNEEQIAQKVCGVSILGGTQSSTSQPPEQPALAGCALTRNRDWTASRDPFQCKWFYDSELCIWDADTCMCCMLPVKKASGFSKYTSVWKERQHRLTISLHRIPFSGYF